MATGKRFNIPSLEDMDVQLEDPQKTFKRVRQMQSSSHASQQSMTSVLSHANTMDVSTESVQRNDCQESAFQKCFGKLKVNTRHREIQDNIKKLKTDELNLPSLPRQPHASNTILVNPKQQGNPLLPFIRNIPWEYSNIVPDYVMGRTTCALFLSRIKQLGDMYELRILLVLVDVKDCHVPLQQLTRIACLADCTLLLAWSSEEAGRYIETYKVFENKPATLLMKKQEPDTLSKVINALTTVKTVNKNDAMMLLITFRTLENIINASEEQLSFVSGIGQQKGKNLHSIFRNPFLKNKKN